MTRVILPFGYAGTVMFALAAWFALLLAGLDCFDEWPPESYLATELA